MAATAHEVTNMHFFLFIVLFVFMFLIFGRSLKVLQQADWLISSNTVHNDECDKADRLLSFNHIIQSA